MNKKLILWLSLLIAFGLISYSCRNESLDVPREHQHSQIDKFVSFQKFLQVTGINENQFHQNLTAKTFSSDDFDIDTEKIRQTLRNNEIKAFSFLITPKGNVLVPDNTFYNLAYIRQSDNTWNKYVVKYVSNDLNFRTDLQNNPELKFQGSNEVVYSENNVSKVSSTGLCAFTSEVEVWNCPAGHTKLADCYESGGTSSCCIGCIHFDSVTIVKECSTANQGGGSPGDADGDGFPDNPDPGSGGGEGDGNIFEPSLPLYDPKANDNPCIKTKISINNANAVLHNITVKNQMDTVLKEKVGATNEYAIGIGQKPNGYEVTLPAEGEPTKSTIPVSLLTTPYIADGHSHSDRRGNPSGGDLYAILKKLTLYTSFQMSYVYGSNLNVKEVYALVVNDRNLALSFLAEYPESENYDELSHGIKEESELGKVFKRISDYYYLGTSEDSSGENYESRAVAMAYILDKFNAGISIAKVDGDGNLKKINASIEQITVPYSGGTKKEGIKVSKCP